MTLEKHVYAIQNIISRGAISDNKDFSNDLIAHFLKVNRSVLIKRKLDKEIQASENLRVTICLPMEEAQIADCPGCGLPDVNCDLYRSVIQLPDAIVPKIGSEYIARKIDGSTISKYTITNRQFDKFNVVGKLTSGYFVHNKYLYFIAPPGSKMMTLLLDFIPESPEDVEELNLCQNPTIGDSDPCRLSDVAFTIDPELVLPMYQMTLELLGLSYNMPEDDLENGVSADLNKSNE